MAHATSQGAPQERWAGSGGGSGRPRLADHMLVPARRSLIVPFRELQPSLRQLRRVYRGTRALLMGEEEVGDRSQLAPSALATPPPRSHADRAECAPHSRAGGHPPRRRHLSGAHALAAHWCRGLCTLCPGKAQGEAQGKAQGEAQGEAQGKAQGKVLVSGGRAYPHARTRSRTRRLLRELCGSCADPAAGASNDERPLPLRSHDVPFPGGLSSGMHAARRAPRDAPLASRSSTTTLLATPLIRRRTSASDARARLRGDNSHSHLDSLDEKETVY